MRAPPVHETQEAVFEMYLEGSADEMYASSPLRFLIKARLYAPLGHSASSLPILG